MSLPKSVQIQLTPGKKNFVVYFRRKDNIKDSCGYVHSDYKFIESLRLKDLDKFKSKPKRWADIESVLLPGLIKLSR